MGVNDVRLLGDDLTSSAFFLDDDDSGLLVFGFDVVVVVFDDSLFGMIIPSSFPFKALSINAVTISS